MFCDFAQERVRLSLKEPTSSVYRLVWALGNILSYISWSIWLLLGSVFSIAANTRLTFWLSSADWMRSSTFEGATPVAPWSVYLRLNDGLLRVRTEKLGGLSSGGGLLSLSLYSSKKLTRSRYLGCSITSLVNLLTLSFFTISSMSISSYNLLLASLKIRSLGLRFGGQQQQIVLSQRIKKSLE